MKWLEDLQNQPRQEKVKLIWTVAGMAVVILVLIWILVTDFRNRATPDTTVFQTLSRGIKDVGKNIGKKP